MRLALAAPATAARAGAQLAQLLVQRAAVAGHVLRRGARQPHEHAGAVEHGAAAVAAQALGAAVQAARAAPTSSPTAVSAAWVGVEQRPRRRRRSACGRCGGRPRRSPGRAGARPCGTASRRRRRRGRPASRRRGRRRSTSGSGTATRSRSAWRDPGRGVAVLHGREAPDHRPAQPRRRSPASTSSRALPPSPVTTPIVRGRSGRGRARWRASRPSASNSCAAGRPGPAGRPRRRRAALRRGR